MYREIDSNKRNSVILMMIFIAVIIGLGYILEKAFGDGNYTIVYMAIFFSIFSVMISYFQGDKIALATTGAKPIVKEDNRYLYNMVENLCIASGTPMPKLYIMEDVAINAFATGRKPEISSIAVTRGTLEKLTNEELEGVLAHELSHVKNYDIRFMMLVAVLVGAVAMMSNFFLRSRMFGGRSRDDKGNANGIILIIGIILAILSPIIAELIKLAISRKREYLADASGALITRYPEGLASALEKISLDNQPMARASSATAHLFIASPFSGKKISGLFSTHPPIEERIARLRGMGR
jgi:heat shock protein HtpX